MADERDEQSEQDVRASIEAEVRGEVRLGHRDDEDLIDYLGDGLIEDSELSEDARSRLRRYLGDRIRAERGILNAEMTEWPEKTDCDRLDAAIYSLNRNGIVLWAVSPCCNTCTMAEFPEYVDFLTESDPSLRNRLRGYAYFYDQGMAEDLAENTTIRVYLGFGSTRGDEVDDYETEAIQIGREVADALRTADLHVEWNGELSKKIGLSLDWKRRPE